MRKKEKITEKTISCGTWHNLPEERFVELNQEDREMYLYLRGGFAAK